MYFQFKTYLNPPNLFRRIYVFCSSCSCCRPDMNRYQDDDLAKIGRLMRITPPSYKGAIRNFFKRIYIRIRKDSFQDLLYKSFDSNLRCLQCGWLYNLDRTSECPICGSDRSRLYKNDDPFLNPGYWLVALLITTVFYIWGYGMINQIFHTPK